MGHDIYSMLDDDHNVIEATLTEWEAFIDPKKGFFKIKETLLNSGAGISTVFIGMDHELFETVTLGCSWSYEEWRCDTYDEALEQHEIAIQHVRDSISEPREEKTCNGRRSDCRP